MENTRTKGDSRIGDNHRETRVVKANGLNRLVDVDLSSGKTDIVVYGILPFEINGGCSLTPIGGGREPELYEDKIKRELYPDDSNNQVNFSFIDSESVRNMQVIRDSHGRYIIKNHQIIS